MALRNADLVLVQASSVSWSGGLDPCMRKIAGKPLLAHTLTRARSLFPDAPVIIAAPAFDSGHLDALASGVPGCTVQYGFDDKPLLRLLQATAGLSGDAVILRLDGQHCFFQEDNVRGLIGKLRADDLDLARSPDNYPPPLTGDAWRVRGLRAIADLLERLPPHDSARHYVHPKFLAMRAESGLRTACVSPPPVSDGVLREIRRALSEALLDHADISQKAIPAGDQISFHYRIASGHAKAGDRVLDIASGQGFGGNLLADRGCETVCADIDEAKLAQGRALFRRDDLTFSHQDVLDTTFPDAAFDLVTSMETMEHVTDVDRYFTELRRVLRPNGLLIVSTPQNSIGHIPLTPSHRKEFSLEEFRALCGRHFHVEDIIGLKAGTIFFPDDPVGANSMAVLRKR